MRYFLSLAVLFVGALCFLQSRTIRSLVHDLALARGEIDALEEDNSQLVEDLRDAHERLRVLDQSLRALQILHLERSRLTTP